MLTTDYLVSGDDAFFVMTGITDGELLHGVRYGRDRAITESLVMRSRSGTIRQVRSTQCYLDACRCPRAAQDSDKHPGSVLIERASIAIAT